MIRRFTVLSAFLFISACGSDDPGTSSEKQSPPETTAASAESTTFAPIVPWAVSAAHPLATQAGADVLAKGGTAVDAAIAVQSVLGLVEPQSSGLGGGAFMLYYDADSGELLSYDGREIAPASATPDMFLNEDGTKMNFYDAVTSGKSVGVPGAVSMLEMAHKAHGKLPWGTLFESAEQHATDGFEASARLSQTLARFKRFAETDATKGLYYNDTKQPLSVGDLVQNPAYAETVKAIAEGGADAFYNGPIAAQIIDAVNAKAGDGTLTLADFQSYEPIVREPVCAPFLTYQVCSMAPPSSGGVTLVQILALVENRLTTLEPNPENWQAYAEASRLAYADRDMYLADPSAMTFGNATAEDIIDGLVAPDYLSGRAGLIGPTAAETVEPGDPISTLREEMAPDASPNLPGTSHFSIRDGYGNIVSMTTTVEFAFGSHLMAGGMVLNNQLTDFSFLPVQDGKPVANAIAPGKRPRSSMAPSIVFDQNGDPIVAIGSPGGPAIIGYVAKTLLAHLAWNMPLQDAIELPHVVVPRGSVIVEEGIDEGTVAALTEYGFQPTERSLASGLYGFSVKDGQLEGGVDPRREGSFLSAE